MNHDIRELIELWEDAKKEWNSNADEFNHWDNLSMEEKLELMLSANSLS